jgi:pentatricopeptide repeat protein
MYMIEKLEEIKAARAKIIEGGLTIWNARLDMYSRSGDMKKLDEMLRHAAQEDGYNCDCNCRPTALLSDVMQEKVNIPER